MSDKREIAQEDRGYLYSEQWRRICLARYLLDSLDIFQRRAWLGEMRNKAAAEIIKQDLIEEVHRRRVNG